MSRVAKGSIDGTRLRVNRFLHHDETGDAIGIAENLSLIQTPRRNIMPLPL